MNPVDDKSFMGPLVKSLRGHVDAFAASMAGTRSSHSRLEAVRPAAACWVYYSALVAWAEDHQLIDPWLRKDAEGLRGAYLDAGGTARDWLGVAYTALAVHPATQCLLDPGYSQLRDHTPSEAVCRDLVEWWTADAPGLAYEVNKGPEPISGWIIGDILQHLRDPRPGGTGGGNAQTPWWVADLILDRTLVPAVDAFRDEPVLRTIDPACGTGHILIRKIDYLWEWYTTGSLACRQTTRRPPITGGPVLAPIDAITAILAGVDGCEIDPLTAAVARLRVTVAIGELLHRSGLLPTLRLDRIPPFQPRIVVGDSLLAGKITAAEYARLHPRLAAIHNLGYTDEPQQEPSQVALFGGSS